MDELINRRSGRKRNHKYSELEERFQQAQKEWAANENDIKAWQTMFGLIQLAVFNSINKKLECKLEREEIEQRSLDITADIMSSLKRKRAKGNEWKIDKVSSYVYMPCMAIYSPSLQFQDKQLPESSFISVDDSGKESMINEQNAIQTDGFVKFGHDETDFEEINEKRNAIIEAIEIGCKRVMAETGCQKEEIERVILKCSEHGEYALSYMTNKEKTLLYALRGEQPPVEKNQQSLFPDEDSELRRIK